MNFFNYEWPITFVLIVMRDIAQFIPKNKCGPCMQSKSHMIRLSR